MEDKNLLINPNGVLIKPMNRAHMMKLLQSESRWVTGPDGEPRQVGGFRRPTQAEIDDYNAKAQAQSDKMARNEFETKKRNAQLVMVAPDEAQLERLIEAREGRKPERKKKADAE